MLLYSCPDATETEEEEDPRETLSPPEVRGKKKRGEKGKGNYLRPDLRITFYDALSGGGGGGWLAMYVVAERRLGGRCFLTHVLLLLLQKLDAECQLYSTRKKGGQICFPALLPRARMLYLIQKNIFFNF